MHPQSTLEAAHVTVFSASRHPFIAVLGLFLPQNADEGSPRPPVPSSCEPTAGSRPSKTQRDPGGREGSRRGAPLWQPPHHPPLCGALPTAPGARPRPRSAPRGPAGAALGRLGAGPRRRAADPFCEARNDGGRHRARPSSLLTRDGGELLDQPPERGGGRGAPGRRHLAAAASQQHARRRHAPRMRGARPRPSSAGPPRGGAGGSCRGNAARAASG